MKWGKGERITMGDFKNFHAEFRTLRADCPEMGKDEAKNLYVNGLPLFLAEAVQKDLLRKEKRPRAIFVGLQGHSQKSCGNVSKMPWA